MMQWANIKTISTKGNLIRDFFINRHYISHDSETYQPEKQNKLSFM